MDFLKLLSWLTEEKGQIILPVYRREIDGNSLPYHSCTLAVSLTGSCIT